MKGGELTWDGGGATLLAALLAAAVVVVGYFVQQGIARATARGQLYADALRAVNDYLEAQYLVKRHDGSSTVRWDIIRHLSDVQSRLMYYQSALVQLAPTAVAEAYAAYVAAARTEAGEQMKIGWAAPPIKRDEQVSRVEPVPHPDTDRARNRLVDLMSPRAMLAGRGVVGLAIGSVLVPAISILIVPMVLDGWSEGLALAAQALSFLVFLALGVYLWPMKRARLPAAILVSLAAAMLAGTSLLLYAF
jgi:hypothetical protein